MATLASSRSAVRSRLLSRPVLGLVWGALLLASADWVRADDPPAATPVGGGSETVTQADLDRRVQALIQQLGAPQYASRERAQAELQRLGLTAFDALLGAQQDEDIEIALRARYLLRSMQVNWAQETDPPEVKRVLKLYGEQSPAERHNRMVKLSKLPDQEGLDALCRLARFETSDVLAKQAALLIMGQMRDHEGEHRLELARRIDATVGLSKRTSGQWLRAYCETLRDPAGTVDRWQRLTAQERETLVQYPDKSNPLIVRDLLRWNADLLFDLRRDDEASGLIRDSLAQLEGNREDLLEIVDWLLVRSKWPLVETVAEKFKAEFSADAQLTYRLAEAALKQGRQQEADQIANLARQLNADKADEHILVAYSLQERGLREWAKSEYRLVIKISAPGSLEDLRSRFLLSELLHDGLEELAAAEVLQDVVNLMDKDEAVNQQVRQRLSRDPGSIRSRMHYFYARHYASRNDRQKQLEHLEKGVVEDPTDADLLIAMYRVPDPDPAWRKKTLDFIQTATDKFRQQVTEAQQQAEQAPQEEFRAWAYRQLATAHNQLAWLVANTTGDYDEALRSSHRSLELRPGEAGYLDTLGRCYYAKGDYESAVKYQGQAVKLEPHSGAIVRQYELFQKALAESKETGKASTDAR